MVKTRLTAFTDEKFWPFKSILQTHQVLNKVLKRVMSCHKGDIAIGINTSNKNRKDTGQGGQYTVVHRVFCVGRYFKTHQVLIKLQYKQLSFFRKTVVRVVNRHQQCILCKTHEVLIEQR